MADIINLRLARKARHRADEAARAAASRARHGRTKGERARDAAATERLVRTVDGARRERGETEER